MAGTRASEPVTPDVAPTDPGVRRSARRAGLHYSSDDSPGLTRRKRGNSFTYWTAAHRQLRAAGPIARIRALAIPPAWRDVWICPSPDGHVQATGRDARGRKQYRYHPRWREVRDDVKYGRLLLFASALPKIRRQVASAQRRPTLSREKVLSTIVQLLEKTLIRVGNEEYARTNGSFGLTTMRDRHVEVKGGTIFFTFRAKSGVRQRIRLSDASLARTVKRCQDLPGQTLFQYEDENGPQTVGSGDVNDYLRELTGQDFTAKDFRTWFGTVLAAEALRGLTTEPEHAVGKTQVTRAIEQVASRLGNTQAVCRKCYIHPGVVDAYLAGRTIAVAQAASGANGANGHVGARRGLSSVERAVVKLLREMGRRRRAA